MKFVLASWGSRGDIEPAVAVGRELVRRGHEVRVAVPPELVGFAESAGLVAVAYGLDNRSILEAHGTFAACLFRSPWRVHHLITSYRAFWDLITECWKDISTTLTSLADGADLLFTGQVFEDPVANVAEHYDIPLATLHWFPLRAIGQVLPFLPSPLGRLATTAEEWRAWRMAKKMEDEQRRQLGLPKATCRSSRRITERGSLEIQAYDEVLFPGLAAEWAKFDGQRPFVGALTMELPTDADEEVASWIAAGTPPIYFGFGSMLVESTADTLAMISAACADLGERALVCAGQSDFSAVPHFPHVKVVRAVNFAKVFPACRAVVHHGGAGTLAAGLRAGRPTLILWMDIAQLYWGDRVKRLKVGTARRFAATTRESLVADLRTILAPECVARARELASKLTKPAESLTATADLVEKFALSGKVE
jgi:UDP:flavonoid glycosyltransferase YjiC (YdhE family)